MRFGKDLDWIVMRCLEKDRSRRYESAIDIAADLRRYLDHEPIVARPPSTVYRLQKALRRNKLAFGAAGAVVAALCIGLGAVTWAFVRENRAYERTLAAEREQSRLRAEAEQAREAAAQQRDLAQARLYESLVREARSIRTARQVGYRQQVLDRLDQALALRTPNLDIEVLRREAVACLGDWVGLAPLDLTDPGGRMTADALLDDGSLLALGGSGGRISLRETQSGREIGSLQLEGVPVDLAFHQGGEQLFVMVVDAGNRTADRRGGFSLEKWSRQSSNRWSRDWRRVEPGLFALLPSADGPVTLILDASETSMRVLDLARNSAIALVPVDARIPTAARAALSADRSLLAFVSLEAGSRFDAQVEVWELAPVRRTALLQPRLGPGKGLSFDPQSRRLACSFDNTLVVYETDGFNATLSRGGSFTETSGAAIGGSDELLIVPSYQEAAVHVVELSSGAELATLRLPGLPLGGRFSPDGSMLVLRHDAGCRIIRLTVEHEAIRLAGHVGGVPAVEFSPTGKQLASTGKDRTLRVWAVTSPGASRVLGHLPSPGQALAYTPDGRMLVCGDYNTGGVSIWSVETGEELGRLAGRTDVSDSTWACAVSPDGRHLAAVGNGLRVWPWSRLEPSFSIAHATDRTIHWEPNGVANVVFDPSGKRLAYLGMVGAGGQWPSALFLLELKEGARPELAATNNLQSFVQMHCFMPRSGLLAYVTNDRHVAFLDPTTRQVVRQFPTLQPGEAFSTYISNIRVSPDESRLAMLTPSGLGVDLWDPHSGRKLYTLPEAPGSVWWLAWSPDSRHLAVSRANGDITVWKLDAVEAELTRIGFAP